MCEMVLNTVSVLNLGRLCYRKSLQAQQSLVKSVKAGGASTLILVEHPPVYTTGIRSGVYSAGEEQRLVALGADFVRTDRGGLITFHGPGQLVAYPILNLKHFLPHKASEGDRSVMLRGMKWYVERLEQMVIDLIKGYGLQGERSPHTGVWLGDSKICALGVHSSDLVTSHGLALNVNTDMSWFRHIVPCGIEGKGVTSLKEQGIVTSVEAVGNQLVQQFETTFNCDSDDSQETTYTVNFRTTGQ